MAGLRKRLACLAALTLAAQVGVIAAASAALCCATPAVAAADTEMACCKDSGKPHVCPIKKKPAPGTPVMKSCCDTAQYALAALFAYTGIPVAIGIDRPSPEASPVIVATSDRTRALALPPESPPPRT
jgi:hypothetical protein